MVIIGVSAGCEFIRSELDPSKERLKRGDEMCFIEHDQRIRAEEAGMIGRILRDTP